MTIPTRALRLGAVLLLLEGCATAKPRSSVHGRNVEVRRLVAESEKDRREVKGELLAVDTERLFVLAPGGVRVIPRDEIEQVRVKLHGLDGSKAGLWALLGGLVTGGALAAACASVEDAGNCGAAFGASALVWGVIGVPAALDLRKTSRLLVTGSELASLRPYARYPQGFPEGLDPARLVASGQGASRAGEASARGAPRR